MESNLPKEFLFYVKDSRDNSIWGITDIDTTDNKREGGWLNGLCIDAGNNEKNFVGADIGFDSRMIFQMNVYDISKNKEF